MIEIVHYDPKYYDQIIALLHNFYIEFAEGVDPVIDPEEVNRNVDEFIARPGNDRNSFLLLANGVVQGVLAGNEIKSLSSGKKVYHEVMWYMNPGFGRYGIWLINKAAKELKDRGFEMMIMTVVESTKAARIENIYKSLRFGKLETHYIKDL